MRLGEYLKEEGIKRGVFASKIGVSVVTLDNIIDGYDTRISVGVAIEKATRGRVKVQELAPTRQRPSKAKKDQTSIQTNP
jgi:DNA-binding transcriptional regulator YdaS (Cro superfamily)